MTEEKKKAVRKKPTNEIQKTIEWAVEKHPQLTTLLIGILIGMVFGVLIGG